MKKKETAYSLLIGKNKYEVLQELGDELNVPFAKIWTYKVKHNFFAKRRILLLYFDENNRVEKFEVKNKWLN